ncbi:MAG TPA: hypothetical protein VHF25_05640 [Nitriliruptorales bacterium]|nr:hypothetical protein [Nitriliruptorales bacterium]
MNRRVLKLLTLTAVVAGSFAAGGLVTATAQQDPSGPPPCTLVTPLEAEATLGGEVTSNETESACTHVAVVGHDVRSLTVTAPASDATSEAFAEGLQLYAEEAGVEIRGVPEVGPDAYATLGKDVSQISALVNGRALTIVAYGLGTSADEQTTTLRDLGQKAAGRI